MQLTLDMIKALDAADKELTFELAIACDMYAKNTSNSIADRAAALRIICQYMPRKQGGMTDEQFVNSFVRGDAY